MTETLKQVIDNDRFMISLFSGFVLTALLLVYDKLNPWVQNYFVPGLVCYCIGTALIAQIQNMIGNRVRLTERQRNADAGTPEKTQNEYPIPTRKFVCIVVAHVLLLIAFAAFCVFAREWLQGDP